MEIVKVMFFLCWIQHGNTKYKSIQKARTAGMHRCGLHGRVLAQVQFRGDAKETIPCGVARHALVLTDSRFQIR